MERQDDFGDQFHVDYSQLLDASTWHDDNSSFPTGIVLFDQNNTPQKLIDGTTESYPDYLDLTSDITILDTIASQLSVFSDWESARLEVTLNIGYTLLPNIFVQAPLLTIYFIECMHMPDNFEEMPDINIE